MSGRFFRSHPSAFEDAKVGGDFGQDAGLVAKISLKRSLVWLVGIRFGSIDPFIMYCVTKPVKAVTNLKEV